MKYNFNQKDVARMLKACEYYKSFTTGYMKEEYDNLVQKLHNYEEEIDCPDCTCCEIHS
ncbi:hypothetical protein CPXG_00172 [Cyanophage P-RSM6]|uniref:hypothetical protein n=1 Tax=Cyanophage P-RSM6 TaxID=929832 RepID=UPI0002C17FC1|nr:hypothetical protein CPXG_00172 [Cyanophage P-RSM6]AGH56975.1 hypothetical protein CPXG_00172 [Cyanophage P-RSM6]